MTVFGFIVGLILLGWGLWPLFQKDSTWVSIQMDAADLEDRKQRVYGNIADLEFDYAMGRLSEADFDAIRSSFLAEAGKVIEKIEGRQHGKLMDRIDKDADSSLKGKSSGKKSGKKFCSQCGEKNKANAKFCTSCGEAL